MLDHSIVPYIYTQSSFPEPLIIGEIGTERIVIIGVIIASFIDYPRTSRKSPITWRLSISDQRPIDSCER